MFVCVVTLLYHLYRPGVARLIATGRRRVKHLMNVMIIVFLSDE